MVGEAVPLMLGICRFGSRLPILLLKVFWSCTLGEFRFPCGPTCEEQILGCGAHIHTGRFMCARPGDSQWDWDRFRILAFQTPCVMDTELSENYQITVPVMIRTCCAFHPIPNDLSSTRRLPCNGSEQGYWGVSFCPA